MNARRETPAPSESAIADFGSGKAAGYFAGALGFGGLVTESVGNIGIAFLIALLSVRSGPNSIDKRAAGT